MACDHYFVTGYLAEAVRCGERLIELEPLSSLGYYRKGLAEKALGRADDAHTDYQKALELGGVVYSWNLATVELARGNYEVALNALTDSSLYGWSADDARLLIDNVLAPGSDPSFLDDWIAEKRSAADGWLEEYNLYLWYLQTGDMDAYWRAIDERFEAEPNEWNDTDWLIREGIAYPQSGFRRHPRFLEFARELGIVDAWEVRGAPDFCSKDSGEWVCN
jgi:tetratricopeptide (TPR) repeat protein